MLHVDLKAGDRLFYYTTCGWMMWNWLASGLASGATLVLYDSSPFHPSPAALFDYAQDVGINVMGVSAKYIDAIAKQFLAPARTHRLDALRTILSTGSPLMAEGFDYVYRSVKQDLRLSSMSGGTDLISCFVLGNPLLPVWRGEIQSRGLGMRSRFSTMTGAPLAAAASWSARDRFRRCRSDSGTTRTASSTAPHTSRNIRTSGATATGASSPRTAA